MEGKVKLLNGGRYIIVFLVVLVSALDLNQIFIYLNICYVLCGGYCYLEYQGKYFVKYRSPLRIVAPV